MAFSNVWFYPWMAKFQARYFLLTSYQGGLRTSTCTGPDSTTREPGSMPGKAGLILGDTFQAWKVRFHTWKANAHVYKARLYVEH